MKRIYLNSFIGTAVIALFMMSCTDILDEQPRSIYTPDYFKTQKGVMGGLTGMYAHLRYFYGNGYYYESCQAGTDEGTYGSNVNNDSKWLDNSGQGNLTSQQNPAAGIWGVFPNINTASGIIENATAVGTVPNSMIAEARFFRAFDYFLLVQTFGGVPLDLGAGELKFNTSTSRTSIRNTVPEVYTKAIFPGLLTAVTDLPANGRVTGGVTKTVARLYLAKAYLTYGWWLENPNNIPTYPDCARTDPDGHNAAWYYQQAYTVATSAIADPGPFGLLANYYDVNLGSNDRNKEILLYADHTQASELYNAASLTYSGGGVADNFASWMSTWNYTNIRSATNTSWTTVISSVQREASQPLGRPWTGTAPPIGIFTTTFADKTNDSRYDGTFATVHRGNWPKGGIANAFVYNANNLQVLPGEPILTFLDNDDPAIDYSNSVYKSNVGAGVLPGRADFVIGPSGISRFAYPILWKINPYRTDSGTSLGQPNAASTRPFVIAKFSELYFIAAEAAVKGATTTAGQSARELINVIRTRAGKWRWNNNGNVAKVVDNSAAMIAATPATIDINYILAERSREFFGEGYRWYDLVRTQKWAELAGTYRICGPNSGDHTTITVTRTIDSKLYLRPIPQGQLDGMEMTKEEKIAYQNPAYR
jgi:hypothetical protein